MKCSKCQREIIPGQKFCNHCGQSVSEMPAYEENVQKCHSCGSPLSPGVKFCKVCGQSVVDASIYEENVQKCHSCGSPLSPGVKFCKVCGTAILRETSDKKKKSPAVLILSIALAVVLIIGGVIVYLAINDSLPFLSDSEEQSTRDDDETDEKDTDDNDYNRYNKNDTADDSGDDFVISTPPSRPIEDIEDAENIEDIEDIEDTDDFLFPSDRQYITYEDLEGRSQNEVALIRNEIYARHGYVFTKEEYQEYFGSKSWYVPDPNFNIDSLNTYEKTNSEFILQYEKDKGWK